MPMKLRSRPFSSRVSKDKIPLSDHARRGYRKTRFRFRISLLFLLLVLYLLGVAKYFELHHVANSSEATFPKSLLSRLPPQCHDLAARFHQSQEEGSSDKAVVLACHRKWCPSYGHCDPCAGIGDRTRFMLSLVTDALDRGVRVLLDYPQPGLLVVEDALYRDPAGFLGEAFHFRSYSVDSRTIDLKKWGKERNFVHFFPKGYHLKNYDPCLFHILLQPDDVLRQRIDSQLAGMGPNRIGIHFRTGDTASFGVKNGDNRVVDIESSFTKMMDCATRLGQKLFPDQNSTAFYLATDNRVVKDLSLRFEQVRTLDINPASYLRAESEMDAWLDLFLLSHMKGFVMNTRHKGSNATSAQRVSTFALLVQRIGFLENQQLMECEI